MALSHKSCTGITLVAITAACTVAWAQYPPQQAPGVPTYAASQVAPAPAPGSFRQLFAGTLGTVMSSVQGALLVGLTQTLTGGIQTWFARKQAKLMGAPRMRSEAGETVGDGGGIGTDPVMSAEPQSYDTSYYNPSTGASLDGAAAIAPSIEGAGSSGALYAGVAYEIHALAADGSSMPVDPSNHVFSTGDRFVVYYRPSMPGRMTVFNINPLGVESQIDASTMAAGQLTTLGPYQFANTTGDEQLRLVLVPCSTPELLVASRDIINASVADTSQATVQATVAAPMTAPGVALQDCDAPTTRSLRPLPRKQNRIRTRDIQKVALEGSTSFALDPVSSQEAQSGELTPREITIRFVHR